MEAFQKPEDSKLPESKDETRAPFPLITYLHRTVRDYLEKPEVWKGLLVHIRNTQPEPKSALLMHNIIRIKRTSGITQSYITGQAPRILNIAQRLDESSVDVRVALIDELDWTFTHSLGEPQAFREHWSNGLLDGIQTDIWSISLTYNLHWYVTAKLVSHSELGPYISRNFEGIRALPLLAYALGFHRWAAEGGSVPDVELVELLLKLKADPNVIYEGYTIWQYALEYLNSASESWGTGLTNTLVAWRRTFELMLQHNADPFACCIGDINVWNSVFECKETGGSGYQSPWTVSFTSFHGKPRDATAVMFQAFGKMKLQDLEGLTNTLEEKKAALKLSSEQEYYYYYY